MNRRRALATLAGGLALPGLWRGVYAADSGERTEALDALDSGASGAIGPVRLSAGQRRLLDTALARLDRLQKLVGHANFNLLDYPRALELAAGYRRVGEFGAAERRFLEQLFYADAAAYGFSGPRLIGEIDHRIARGQREKIPHSGHYLFRDQALGVFQRLQSDVGNDLILTSGIRGVVKQMHLFLARVRYSRGNLSDAARSLAPPAYSFHSVGDFDVGQRDFGYANFTGRFVESEVYRQLRSLDYVRQRYAVGNALGMRFEPWHVEVAPS